MYLGGLKNGSVRAILMANWQTGKYASLMDLQNDDAKNYLWRSSTIITPRSGGSNSRHDKGKAHMQQPNAKRPQPIVYGQNNSGSHGSFGPSSSKSGPNTLKSWGHPNDAKAYFKGSSKSTTFDNHSERERSSNSMNCESWNRAKKRISPDEFNLRRNTSACMNFGEVGHVFNDCPKPKP